MNISYGRFTLALFCFIAIPGGHAFMCIAFYFAFIGYRGERPKAMANESTGHEAKASARSVRVNAYPITGLCPVRRSLKPNFQTDRPT